MPRVLVKLSEVLIGQALPWDVYDPAGNLLLPKGSVIAGESEKSALLKRRGMRELDERSSSDSRGSSATPRPQDAQEQRRESRLPLEETRLLPGDAIQLQGGSDTDRYVVRLIGYLKGRSLVVTNPVVDGAAAYLREGQSFVARAFSGKLACAFPCSVMTSSSKPYSYVHLTYPSEVRAITVRSGERVKLRAIAALELEDGGRASGVIVDMSIGGAQLMSRSPTLTKDILLVIKFKIEVGNLEYLMELKTQICSIRASEEDTDLGQTFGIRFVDVTPEDNLVLSAFVFQRLAENQLS